MTIQNAGAAVLAGLLAAALGAAQARAADKKEKKSGEADRSWHKKLEPSPFSAKDAKAAHASSAFYGSGQVPTAPVAAAQGQAAQPSGAGLSFSDPSKVQQSYQRAGARATTTVGRSESVGAVGSSATRGLKRGGGSPPPPPDGSGPPSGDPDAAPTYGPDSRPH